jgi:hypothetical protein
VTKVHGAGCGGWGGGYSTLPVAGFGSDYNVTTLEHCVKPGGNNNDSRAISQTSLTREVHYTLTVITLTGESLDTTDEVRKRILC